MLAIRPVGQLVAELGARRREPAAVFGNAREALAAGLALGTAWWVFGTSGTGDAWLLRRTERGSP
jgi:predicted small integral membrane protein